MRPSKMGNSGKTRQTKYCCKADINPELDKEKIQKRIKELQDYIDAVKIWYYNAPNEEI